MDDNVRTRRVVLAARGVGETEDRHPSKRTTLADALGRMPNIERLLTFAERPTQGQGRFLEVVLLARNICNAKVEVVHLTPGVCQRRLDRRRETVRAQWLAR